MATSNRRLDRALHLARQIRTSCGQELRLGRNQAGLSQDAAAAAVGISGSQFGRLERGEIRGVTLEQLARASAAVGLRPALRLYPDGDPIRDIVQVRLLDRLRGRVPSVVPWRNEVPVGREPDRRAWDAVFLFPDGRIAFEAESRVLDAQATWRRVALKLRDDPSIDHLILLVADTPANRRAIAEVRELLRGELPSTREPSFTRSEADAAPAPAGSSSSDPAGGSPQVASNDPPAQSRRIVR